MLRREPVVRRNHLNSAILGQRTDDRKIALRAADNESAAENVYQAASGFRHLNRVDSLTLDSCDSFRLTVQRMTSNGTISARRKAALHFVTDFFDSRKVDVLIAWFVGDKEGQRLGREIVTVHIV